LHCLALQIFLIIVDTANHKNQSSKSENNDRVSAVAAGLDYHAAPKNGNAAEKNFPMAAEPSTLCIPEKNQKVVGFKMNKSSNNAESGFVSCSSSDSASNFTDEASAGTSVIVGGSVSKTNEYVNFSSGKSFLKVDLKSAIYSHGYLSIWVKITYRIYEKISDTDWIGLYYVGKCKITVRQIVF
jgi:hypothetical protein